MTVKNVTIHRMQTRDAKSVCKMVKAFAALSGDKARVTERDLLAHCLGPKKTATIFVAVVGKRRAGFAITRDWMNFYLGARFRHIDFLFVEHDYTRRGIGTMLIKFTAQDAVKMGCTRLSIDAATDNEAANGLYKKLGFETRANHSVQYRLSDSGLKRLAMRDDSNA